MTKGLLEGKTRSATGRITSGAACGFTRLARSGYRPTSILGAAWWGVLPDGFVTYGGIAAGTRALQLLKPVLCALKLVSINEAVNIPFVAQYIKDDTFVPNDSVERAVPSMLKELRRWSEMLGQMRAPAS